MISTPTEVGHVCPASQYGSMMMIVCQGAGLFACYLLFAGQLSWSELGVALPSAALATAFLFGLRRVETRRLSLRTRFWPRLVGRTLYSVPSDSLRVGLVLLKAVLRRPDTEPGAPQRQPFRLGGNDPANAGRRALVTLGSSLAPNGYVLDELATGDLLVHRLQPMPPKSDRDWPV